MIANGRSRRRERAGTSDTETLQTDVMRFVAIIGLCLTAVFALVRSLPVAQEEVAVRTADDVAEPGPQPLQQDLAEVTRELSRLRQERDAIALALEQAREQVRDLAPVTRQLAELRQERERTQRALEQARERMQALAASNQKALDDRQSATRELAGLKRQLAYRPSPSEQIPAAAEREPLAQQRPEPAPPEPLEPNPAVPDPEPTPQRPPPSEVAAVRPPPVPTPVGRQSDERGFVLRFASAAALDRLVRSGAVGFVGIQGPQAWRLSLSAGRPQFASGPKPARFHEMAPATVPAAYLRAFARVADLAGPDSVTWGVRLPPPMEETIGRLTRNAKGGVLVIRDDGRVVLEGRHAG